MKKFALVVALIISGQQLFTQNSIGLLYISAIDSPIYEKPKFSSSLITVYKHDTVRVIDSTNRYFKVSYKHYTGLYSGYVLRKNFYSWEEYLKKFELPKNKTQTHRLSVLQSKFGKTKGIKLFNGLVWVGMTEEEAYYSLGEPTRRIVKIGSWGSQKRFIYGTGGDFGQILNLYFENGLLAYYIYLIF